MHTVSDVGFLHNATDCLKASCNVINEICTFHSASSAFTGSQDVQSRWLLAQCCMSMTKYTEAEQALNPNNDGTDVRLLLI